jgi:hypothetical protein
MTTTATDAAIRDEARILSAELEERLVAAENRRAGMSWSHVAEWLLDELIEHEAGIALIDRFLQVLDRDGRDAAVSVARAVLDQAISDARTPSAGPCAPLGRAAHEHVRAGRVRTAERLIYVVAYADADR